MPQEVFAFLTTLSESPMYWPAISICVLPDAPSAHSVHTISETLVYQTKFREKVTVKFEEMQGN